VLPHHCAARPDVQVRDQQFAAGLLGGDPRHSPLTGFSKTSPAFDMPSPS
jgi:hypothetical protein